MSAYASTGLHYARYFCFRDTRNAESRHTIANARPRRIIPRRRYMYLCFSMRCHQALFPISRAAFCRAAPPSLRASHFRAMHIGASGAPSRYAAYVLADMFIILALLMPAASSSARRPASFSASQQIPRYRLSRIHSKSERRARHSGSSSPSFLLPFIHERPYLLDI